MPRMRHALANKTNKCSGVYPHGPNNAGKCLSTIPRIRRSCTDTKKSAGSVSVTRPTLRGLRIAHHSKTSNAEAHADMYTNPAYLLVKVH